ncbi:MAG: hypothetical protein WC391_05050 [Methanoregula sp.]
MIKIPIYIDSSTWLDYFLPDRQENYQNAKRQIERIRDVSDYFLISSLVVMEIVGVVRQRVVEREIYSNLSDEKKREIKIKANSEVQRILQGLLALENQHRLMVVNPSGDASDFLNQSLCLLRNLNINEIGDIESRNRCSKCHGNLPNPKYKLVCLGHYDFQHAFIARQHHATEIVSSDRAFRYLPSFEEFRGIQITNPRLA